MIIRNQDNDIFFDTFGGTIFWDEKRTNKDLLMGYNFYGTRDYKDFLLATYDSEEECKTVMTDIGEAIKNNDSLFIMSQFEIDGGN